MTESASVSLTGDDLAHLHRCIELAEESLAAGDEPFGSLLVDPSGRVICEDRNRVKDGDATQHPEFAIARWAAENLSREVRADSVVYTSGEHCPMCSAAHAWVGLGTIVYAASGEQLRSWLSQWGVDSGPVAPLSIQQVAPTVESVGPIAELSPQVKGLHATYHGKGEEER
ncbi:tRNA(Arg) A34 adenosine deaminase TadA [Brevibacterium siliguriense]|uniref:tRNA(Arg) A34 adenosine deaminase TadA n=1 Tax=Brevibacterium siliguriense TaxID=1136497 RepID=A0A1H1V7L0_9MICO|nr:nucleoside deaminase [Brevibacterium siliguriense]SDS80695.1 tRNA(Arg) A34 adenosine deaminase TadA [Brevibacterium siliguriense]